MVLVPITLIPNMRNGVWPAFRFVQPLAAITHPMQVKSSALSDTNDLIPRPPLDTHVFAKLMADAGSVQLDE